MLWNDKQLRSMRSLLHSVPARVRNGAEHHHPPSFAIQLLQHQRKTSAAGAPAEKTRESLSNSLPIHLPGEALRSFGTRRCIRIRQSRMRKINNRSPQPRGAGPGKFSKRRDPLEKRKNAPRGQDLLHPLKHRASPPASVNVPAAFFIIHQPQIHPANPPAFPLALQLAPSTEDATAITNSLGISIEGMNQPVLATKTVPPKIARFMENNPTTG